MYYAVKKVQALENYTLLLTFQTGESKIFDMKPYLNKGIFKELKNEDSFKQVFVSFDTIQWKNEADFDPEVLYENSIIHP